MILVVVEWDDHCEAEGTPWMTRAEAAECGLAHCRSVGWLVHQDDEKVIITSSQVDDDDTLARPFVISAPSVRRIIPLPVVA